MTDFEHRRQRIVQRLLEDEAITADLVDDAAKSLLDWGVAQAEALIQESQDLSQEEFDAQITTLRHTLKRINKQAGEFSPQTQEEQVQALLAEIQAERAAKAKTEPAQNPRLTPDAEYYLEAEPDA